MNKLYLIIIIIILTAGILWFSGIFGGEEAKIHRFISKAEKAVETENLITCTGMVSKNYQDKYGNGYEDILAIAHEFFNYYKEISIKINKTTLTFNPAKTECNVEIYAQVIGKNSSGAEEMILDAEKDHFRVKLNKEDKKWKLTEFEFYETVNIMGGNPR
jgi:hypothetical protein